MKWRADAQEAEELHPSTAAALFYRAGQSSWYRISNPTVGEPSLFVRLARTPDDRDFACTGLAMGLDDDPPLRVTAGAMRIPLQEIIHAIVGTMRFDYVKLSRGGGAGYGEGIGRGLRLDTAAPLEEPRARPGAKGFADSDLQAFAKRYRQALKSDPHAPMQLLAKHYDRSVEAIRYRRRLAEQRGFLTTRGKRPKRRAAARTGKGGKR